MSINTNETQTFFRIPLSGNLYNIDINGQIKTTDNEILKNTLDENGDIVVWLHLWNGWNNYKLANLIMHTFEPVHMSCLHWHKLIVLFKDNDKQNINTNNLIWKFPIGLESKRYPGYAYIPGCSRFVINRDGVVINTKTTLKIKPFINDEGYYFYSVLNDKNKNTRIGRHRALALTWLNYNHLVDKLHVNHINGVTGDDRLINLEWCTIKWNIIHSRLKLGEPDYSELCEKTQVLCRNVINGLITIYDNINLCAEANSLNIHAIFYRIKYSYMATYPDYLQFKYINDSSEWLNIPEYELLSLENNLTKKILLRNAKTNEIKEFSSIFSAASSLHMNYMQLNHILNKENQPIIPDYFQIQRKYKNIKWRKPDDLEEENNIAKYGNGVLSRNVITGEIKQYANATQCAKALGFSNLTISVRLRDKSQKVYPGNLQFKREYDQTQWRDVNNTEQELDNRHYPIRVNIRDIFTNQVWEFDRMQKATDLLGIPMHTLIIKKDTSDYFPYFQYEIKYSDKSFNIYTADELEMFKQSIENKKAFRGRGFKLTSIDSDEVRVYADRQTIMKEFGISKHFVSELAQDKKVFRNKWCFSYFYK